jgi:hypothetical protein
MILGCSKTDGFNAMVLGELNDFKLLLGCRDTRASCPGSRRIEGY